MIRGNKQTKLRTERLYELYYYNSHPQGDGNMFAVALTPLALLQLTPARGWKPLLLHIFSLKLITTHTRKGMETIKRCATVA